MSKHEKFNKLASKEINSFTYKCAEEDKFPHSYLIAGLLIYCSKFINMHNCENYNDEDEDDDEKHEDCCEDHKEKEALKEMDTEDKKKVLKHLKKMVSFLEDLEKSIKDQ